MRCEYGQDRRAAMRRRPQPNELRRQRDRPVVAVARDVIERDVNGQGPSLMPTQEKTDYAIDVSFFWVA